MKLKEALGEAPLQQSNNKSYIVEIVKSPDEWWTASLIEVWGKPAEKAGVEAYGVKLHQTAKSGHEALRLLALNFNKAGFLD